MRRIRILLFDYRQTLLSENILRGIAETKALFKEEGNLTNSTTEEVFPLIG